MVQYIPKREEDVSQDAEKWKDVTNKYKEHFSEKPAEVTDEV